MRLDERRIFDQLLSAEEPCIGAVFCTYTFDPSYFEEYVLRSVLRLDADPDEDARRFHEEARAALQGTPVVCIVDAREREPGRRLPYDLLLARGATFHPKLYLVLFESEARFAIGSGNLTKPGIEQNTELFFVRHLPYEDSAAAEVLRSIDDFLEKSANLAPTQGSQLTLLRQTLQNRVRAIPPPLPPVPRDIQFIQTFTSSILEQLDGALPAQAKVSRVGVLCPFFERDDLDAADPESGFRSTLASLLELRPASDARLDVAVPWDDAPLFASGVEPSIDLTLGVGRLWVWRRRERTDAGDVERIEHYLLQSVAAKRVEALNARGEVCRLDRAVLEEEMSAGRFWAAPRPTVHAPKTVLRRLSEERSLHLWLYPSNQLSAEGERRRRALHAKLLLVTASHRGKTFTYALVGSPNASRAALARGVVDRGNVEAAVLLRFDGEISLTDFLPSLVRLDLDRVDVREREFPVSELDFSVCIDAAIHDAAARTLVLQWNRTSGVALGRWRAAYLDRELGTGIGIPSDDTVFHNFDLNASSAELTLETAEAESQIPILVLDLATLPVTPAMADLGLRELLALLGGRVGRERLATVREQRGAVAAATALDAAFGEGFGPTDVFSAWWGGADALRAAPTIAAFRHLLHGATGLLIAWSLLRDAGLDRLSTDEVWVYGCELLKELRSIDVPAGPDAATKQSLLHAAVLRVRGDLERLAPAGQAWLAAVAAFYGLGATDGDA